MYRYMIIVVSLLLFGCSGGVMPTLMTEGTEEMVFTEQNIPLSKPEIKNKLHMFLNESFESSKAVIQSNEDGLLTGNYVTKLNCVDPFCYLVAYAKINFLIKYSDNKYKLKLILKEVYSKSTDKINNYEPQYWGHFNEDIQNAHKHFDSLLVNYMKSDSNF